MQVVLKNEVCIKISELINAERERGGILRHINLGFENVNDFLNEIIELHQHLPIEIFYNDNVVIEEGSNCRGSKHGIDKPAISVYAADFDSFYEDFTKNNINIFYNSVLIKPW